jgi:hypothetical protein
VVHAGGDNEASCGTLYNIGVGVVVPKEDEQLEEPTAVEATGWPGRLASWLVGRRRARDGVQVRREVELLGKEGRGPDPKAAQAHGQGSLEDLFKKLQKAVGNSIDGAEFKKKYCIYFGELLGNPAKLAHEQEYKE